MELKYERHIDEGSVCNGIPPTSHGTTFSYKIILKDGTVIQGNEFNPRL